MHEIGIEASLVEAIRSGTKTIEGRLGKPRFLTIQPGDTLRIRADTWKGDSIIESQEDALHATVTQVLYFESFAEMLDAVDYTAAVPSANNFEDAVEAYAKFYSAQDEIEYGVIAFYLTPSL